MDRLRYDSHSLKLTAVLLVFSCAGFAGDFDVHYHLERARPLSRFSPQQISLLEKLNRVDRPHLGGLGRLIVPDRWDLDELDYSPMPRSMADLKSTSKAVVVDIPSQVFGAYEYGNLVRWGPVCSGKRLTQTPAGEYNLHWNQRIRISTVDPTWIMPWYFNFDDIIGLGFHEYSLPGRPSSHGCIRMLESDARWLFYWGRKGTRVLVRGEYNFAGTRPWLNPGWWAQGVTFPSPAPQASRSAGTEE